MNDPEIICGDSLQILPTFKDKEFDYFLTSVPFKEEEFGGDDYWNNMDKLVWELERVTSKAGFMFQSSTKMREMFARYSKIMRVLIWGKEPSMYSYRYEPIFVWQFGDFKVNKYLFKDYWRMEAVMENGSTYENPMRLYKQIMMKLPKGRVLDPFAGTGTTSRAARMLGMDSVNIEIDKDKPIFHLERSAKLLEES
jgi:DNA modification methylase